MQILLINSPFPVREGVTHLPLQVAYPAAVLEKEGFKVAVIDLAIENLSDEALISRLKKIAPGLIVINSETTVLQTRDFCFALKLLGKIKKDFKKIPVAMMGAHVTFRDIEVMERHKDIDFIIRYEADYVLKNLAKALENGSNLAKIKGITLRKENKIIQNEEETPIKDLDVLPFPARHLFPVKRYIAKDYETTVQGSRGCTNRCLFCQSSAMDRIIRFRSVPNLIKEIKEVLDMGFQSVFFGDYDFGVNESRVKEFCQAVLKEKMNLRWSCNIRADRIKGDASGREMLRLMKKSGCYRVFIGFESISSQILKNINKKVTPNGLIEAAKLLEEYGIALHASFLFGLPGDTEDTIRATVKFAKKINPQMVSFNILTPFPGTPLGDEPEKYGIKLIDKYWYEKISCSGKNISGNKKLSVRKLQEMGKWAYKEFLS